MSDAYQKLRAEYLHATLRRDELASDPREQFKLWFAAAVAAQLPLANAMTLSTVDAAGRPSSRVVLLKGDIDDGFVFYSNYHSRKGRELAENAHAALLFWWAPMERQIRIEGRCARVSPEMSDAYFASRPVKSNHSAIASRQSEVVPNRSELEERVAKLETSESPQVRPDYWGGFCLEPEYFEFWQGRADRLHDRFRYTRENGATWSLDRLSP